MDPVRDTNGPLSDIWVRDLFNNTIYLISMSPVTLQSSNGGSVRPRISNDGWYVTFESGSDDLVIPDSIAGDIVRATNCPP
jgi:hypothetical protein